ncbi:MAG TPA: chemotaxis protein CheD [Pseudomonadota bacterium]|nr:chemotaxis protein CheD [Pseudomonadota bacterium]
MQVIRSSGGLLARPGSLVPAASFPRNQVTFVVAGEVCVLAEPATLATVLGSCVTVCLWSAARHIGGINHYLVPRSLPTDQNYLGGDRAIPALIEQMMQHMREKPGSRPPASVPGFSVKGAAAPRSLPVRTGGADVHPRQLVAKVFGGAHTGKHDWNGGAENILMAWAELRKAGIPIIAADVGGTDSRRIRFNVATGQVQVQRISSGPPREEPR